MSHKEIIEKIHQEKSNYKYQSQAEDLANSLETISDDIYSESERFIYELIQNADDSCKPNQPTLEVNIEFSNDFMIISHTGRSFNEKDINAISSVGKSQKSENPNQTGYKGIGFKSVFGKSDCVYISSDGYCFRYDKNHWQNSPHRMPWQIIPIWSGEAVPNGLKTTFGKYEVSTAIAFNKEKGFNGEKLKNDLINLFSNSQIMLFLRNVTSITIDNEFSIKKTKKALSNKENGTEKFNLNIVSLVFGTKSTKWLIGEFIGISLDDEIKEYLRRDEKAPKRLKESAFTNISFAAKIDEKGNLENIKDESLIFTYLPTKISKEFPFLVNADFLTNAPREGFHEDRLWNIWLFEQVGYKSIEWLKYLANTDYAYQFTEIIANKFSSSKKQMDIAFNDGFDKAINEIAFIPNKKNTLRLIKNTFIEKTGVISVIKEDVLLSYYNRSNNTSLVKDSFINKKIKATLTLIALGAESFEIKDLPLLFESKEIKAILDIENNFKIIEYFHKKCHAKTVGEFFNSHIKNIKFILNEKNILCSVLSPIFFPENSFELPINQPFNFIHSEVLAKINKNKEIKEWLVELGITAPTAKSIIEKTILKNLDKLITSSDESIELVRYLFANQSVIDDFSKLAAIQLITTKDSLKAANSCYLSDLYKPELAIESFLADADFFVSDSYVSKSDSVKEWNLFFTKIGVKEKFEWARHNISFKDSTQGFAKEYFEPFIEKMQGKNQYAYGGYRYSISTFNVYHFSCIEYVSNIIFSKLYWSYIFKYLSFDLNSFDSISGWSGSYDRGYNIKNLGISSNYFLWTIQNLALFPTINGSLEKANNIFIPTPQIKKIGGNLLPILDLDFELPKDIIEDTEVFNFRKFITLPEYLAILTSISLNEKLERGEITEATERIGLIYKELLNFTRADEKEQIKEWASENTLLSDTNEFVLCNELHYLDIPNFELPDKVKGFIKVPYEVKLNKNLAPFFELLGVKIINFESLDTKKEEAKAEYKLLATIKERLPLIALVVATKEDKEYLSMLNILSSCIEQGSFYTAKKIFIDCSVGNVQIFTIPKAATTENTKFYYTEDWNSPITLYDLTVELCRFFNIEDISKELNVLLLVSFMKGHEWLESLGYDVSLVPLPKGKLIHTEDESTYQDDRTDEQKRRSRENARRTEKFVFEHLKEMYKTQYPDAVITLDNIGCFEIAEVKIVWHNAEQESLKNIDFTITDNNIDKYVEVKSTQESEKDGPPIYFSDKEWALMKESKTRYFLARVFNSLSPKNIVFVDMQHIDIIDISSR